MKREAFEALWESTLKRELEGLEGLRLKERRAILISFSGAFCVFVLLVALGLRIDFTIALAFLATIPTYALLHPKGYREKYKELVIEGLMRQTAYRWALEKDTRSHQWHSDLFRSSGLFRDTQLSVRVDDVFASGASNIQCAELRVERKRGKNDTTIFQGLFFTFNLAKSFAGETYIRKASASYTPVGTLKGAPHLKVTSLEWNEFESLLQVETTNEVEAREILDPRFMAILYDWWVGHKKSMRIGIHGDHLYLGAHFGVDLFEPRAFSSIERHKEELWGYLDAFLLVEKLFDHVEHKYRLTKKLEG